MFKVYLEHIPILKMICLNVKLNWVSCILPDSPTSNPAAAFLKMYQGVNPLGADGGSGWIERQQSLFWMMCLKFEFGFFF